MELVQDDQNGFSCCAQCGRVLEDLAFTSDVQFQKVGGQAGRTWALVRGEK